MKRSPRWAVWLTIVVAGVAIVGVIHRWWPSRTSSEMPFDRVVAELHRLYPIYLVKHVGSGQVIEVDSQAMAQAREHPAYAGGDPCWDLDVTYTDLKTGTDHEIRIVNREKLSERKTSIRIHREAAGRTDVSVSSIETDFLLNVTSRAFFFERQRLQEINYQLRRQAGPSF